MYSNVRKSPKNKVILVLAALIIVFLIVRKPIKSFIAKMKMAMSNHSETGTSSGGQQVEVTYNTFEVAQKIATAHYSNDWFGFSENEEAARTALLGIPSELFSEVANHYRSITGKELIADIYQYWPDDYIAAFEAWRK